MPEQEQLIRIADVAADCRIKKGHARKIVKRLGIEEHKRKSPEERHGQLVTHITKQDADRVKSEAERSRRKSPSQDDGFAPRSPETGVFYLIQLEPELDPGRFKVGFTSDMPQRLSKFRCCAPFLKEVKTWPCKSLWEKTVIDCVTQDCEKLHTEVFRMDSIDTVVKRSDEFFGRMPTP